MAEHAHIVTVDQEPCEQCLDREHRLLRLQEERDDWQREATRLNEEYGKQIVARDQQVDALLALLREALGYVGEYTRLANDFGAEDVLRRGNQHLEGHDG